MHNSQEPQLLQCHCKYVGSKEMFIMIHPCPLGAVARATKNCLPKSGKSICCYFHKWNKFQFISLKSWMTPAERTKQTKLIQVDQVITSPKNWIPKPAITTNHGWQPFQVSMVHGIVKPGSAHPFSWNSSKWSTTQPKRIRSGWVWVKQIVHKPLSFNHIALAQKIVWYHCISRKCLQIFDAQSAYKGYQKQNPLESHWQAADCQKNIWNPWIQNGCFSQTKEIQQNQSRLPQTSVVFTDMMIEYHNKMIIKHNRSVSLD